MYIISDITTNNYYVINLTLTVATSCKRKEHKGNKRMEKWLLVGIFFASLVNTTMSLPIHNHLSAKLPELPENFVDRLEDKHDVKRCLDKSHICNLHGEHGIGKSTLAIKVGREEANRSASAVYYVNVADFPNKNFQTVLARRLLQNSSSISQFHDFNDLISWTKQYYNNEETLFILDNCDSIMSNQMSEFEEAIEKLADHMKILITSTNKLNNNHQHFGSYEVPGLRRETALKLLSSGSTSPSSDDTYYNELKLIATEMKHVPLPLQILASLLKYNNMTTNDIIGRFSKPNSPPTADACGSFAFNVAYERLSQDSKKLACAMAYSPGSFSIEAATWVYLSVKKRENFYDVVVKGVSAEVELTKQTLKDLTQRSLLEFDSATGRFRYHQQIQKFFICRDTKDELNVNKWFLRGFRTYYGYLLYSQQDFKSAIQFLHKELQNIQYLLITHNSFPQCESSEFLATFIGISNALQMGIFYHHFTWEDLQGPITSAVHELEHNRLEMLKPGAHTHLLSLLPPNQIALHIYKYYIQLITKVAEMLREDQKAEASFKFLNERTKTVGHFDSPDRKESFIYFHTMLANLAKSTGNTAVEIESHHQIVTELTRARTQSTLTCQVGKCKHSDIGTAYCQLRDHRQATYFLTTSLEKEEHSVPRKASLLTHLYDAYWSLGETKLANDTWHQIIGLQAEMKKAPLPERTSYLSNMKRILFRLRKIIKEEEVDFIQEQSYQEEHQIIQEKLLIGLSYYYGGRKKKGWEQIEQVLQEIVKDKHLQIQLNREFTIACKFMLPKYIEECYLTQVKKILGKIYHLFTMPLLNGSSSMCTDQSSDHKQPQPIFLQSDEKNTHLHFISSFFHDSPEMVVRVVNVGYIVLRLAIAAIFCYTCWKIVTASIRLWCSLVALSVVGLTCWFLVWYYFK